MITTQDILAVVVLYKSQLSQTMVFDTLLRISPDLSVFVYDNSPTPQICEIPVLNYFSDPANGGPSRAYNCAAQYAVAHGFSYLLLLDQDTSFPSDTLAHYLAAINAHPDLNLFSPCILIPGKGYLSPTRCRMKTSAIQNSVHTGIVRFADACPINSGMCISVETFLAVGGYEEAVWLDFSDVAFIEKYRKHYPLFYTIADIICEQKFSAFETDPETIYHRFCIYLDCARHYPCHCWTDRLVLTLTTLRPTLSRTLRERTLKYISAYTEHYINLHL